MAEYKIRDLEVLTGIKAHTLRIWEKRYGLIQPERTDTQIRTYSDKELTMLLNVALLNKHGIKISKIANMTPNEVNEKVAELKKGEHSDSSTEMLILALIELDEVLFKHTFTDLVNKHGLEKTFSNYIVPFLDRIGVMWLVGSINPAQEHFISTLIRQKVIVEIDKLPIPEKKYGPVILYTPEHEWHELGLLFYNYVLRSIGVYTVYLGQSVPFDSLIECVEKLRPKAIISSWVTAVDKKFMQHYFKDLNKKAEGVDLYAGGFQMADQDSTVKGLVRPIQTIEEVRNYFI
jgi:DNA-binding transcriptional MerR regulator